MYIRIDASTSFSLIFLLTITLPTFCSEENQTSAPGLSTVKEHLHINSHVTEIYFTNETLQNSSISSNENQTLQTTLENQNISITLQIPLKNSLHFKNSTVIDPKWNSSSRSKDHTQKNISNSKDTSNVSSTEKNVNMQSKLFMDASFNHSNVLTFNISIHSLNKQEKIQSRSNEAENSLNSIFNASQNVQDFNNTYNKGNITGVGIKATVSVSFQLMENSNENITETLNRTEKNQNLTEQNSNSNSYNLNQNFNGTNENASATATETNGTNNASTIADDTITSTTTTTEMEIVTQNENQTETFIVTTADATAFPNNTVTESDVYNSTSEMVTFEQNLTTLTNNITKIPWYTSTENVTETIQNITGTSSESTETSAGLETSTALLPETTVTEETTTAKPLTKMAGIMKIIDGLDWKPVFHDHQSKDYKETAKMIRILLEDFYSRTSLNEFLQEIQIDGFSEGSLVIDYYLILKTDPLDVESLVHQVNGNLKKNNYLLGDFTIDPKATEFEVVPEEIRKPTPAPNIEPPVPQWVIAVVVISAASFIFILLFSAVTIYERHYTRRVYNTKLQDDEEIFEKSVTLNGKSNQTAYENLAADLVYDIDKDELEDISQYWKTVR